MEKHRQNIELYLSLGGDPRAALRYQSPTLQNRAKIKYLLSKIPKIKTEVSIPEEKKAEETRQSLDNDGQKQETEKAGFLGLIAQYPIELHQAYNEAYSSWLNLCSLKLQLNKISADDESSAYDIQTEMLKKIRRFDQCKEALDHYNQHKAILPIDSKKDFSKLSELELDREHRNLASNISKRRKTISAKESELPEKGNAYYLRKIASLNKKKLELEEMLLDFEKIGQMLGFC